MPAGPSDPGRACRGLGLPEILVALAIGLFLVNGALSLFIGQLSAHRQRLLALRLTQELRGAMTLIEHELRRAGHWGAAEAGLWIAGEADPLANPYAGLHPSTGSGTELGYTYSRDASENQQVDPAERFGFRLNPNTRTLEMRLSGAALTPADGDSWQPVTDPTQVRITRLAVAARVSTLDLGSRCTAPCPAGASDCPPTLQARTVALELSGQASRDSSLTHTLRSVVHLRADALQGRCPAG